MATGCFKTVQIWYTGCAQPSYFKLINIKGQVARNHKAQRKCKQLKQLNVTQKPKNTAHHEFAQLKPPQSKSMVMRWNNAAKLSIHI